MKFLQVILLAILCLVASAAESDPISADAIIEETATFSSAQFEIDDDYPEDEYEYDEYEAESSEPDLDGPLPDHYKWLKQQILDHLKSKDWEREAKDVLGTKEYGAHSAWLHKNHDKLVLQGDEEEKFKGVEEEESVEVPVLEKVAAPSGGSAEKQQVVAAPKEEKEEEEAEETEVPKVAGDQDVPALPKEPAPQSHEDTDEYDTSSAEQTVPEVPQQKPEAELWENSNEETQDETAQQLLDEISSEAKKIMGSPVLEIELRDDTMDEAEPGLEGPEEDSETFVDPSAIKDAIEAEEELVWAYRVKFAQHRAMVMTVLIMFFILTLALFAFTCFRCMKLLTENAPKAPGAYQRMQEDTESLYTGKA